MENLTAATITSIVTYLTSAYNNSTTEQSYLISNTSDTDLSTNFTNFDIAADFDNENENSTNSSDFNIFDSQPHEKKDIIGFYVGTGLAIISSVFIGASFIIKKKALLNLSKGGKRANQGGFGYLKDLLWWCGFLSMAFGETANFIAYAFAPASVVSTLGVLSVLISTILASKFLKERLNFLGKMGCFLCTIGSTVIVLHAPMEKEIASMEDLLDKISNPLFIIYVLTVVIVSLILIYHFRPGLPETSTRTLLIWIGVCSLIGSLSVMSCKGFGLAITNTASGRNEFTNWLTYFCLITLIICVCVQMNFLNKALDTFNTAVVTPIYYVFFTTCVIVASAILFREFAYVQVNDWLGLISGFATIVCAIVLLHFCKHYDITLLKLTEQIQLIGDKSEIEAESPSCEIQLVSSKSEKEVNNYGTQINLDT